MVCIIARKTSEPLASLVKQIDLAIAENPKLKSFVVLIDEDGDAASAQLTELAKAQSIKNVPLTLFDDAEGPGSYQVSKDAEVTVMMWQASRVKINHAFPFDGFTDSRGRRRRGRSGHVPRKTDSSLLPCPPRCAVGKHHLPRRSSLSNHTITRGPGFPREARAVCAFEPYRPTASYCPDACFKG